MHILLRRVFFCLCILHLSATPAAEQNSEVAKLYREAKAERAVNLWGTNREDLDWIASDFAKAYPGIAINIVTDINVAGRIVTESRLGRSDFDVLWNSVTLTEPLNARKLLASVSWEKYGIPSSSVELSGHMGVTSSMMYVFACNTSKAAISSGPINWEDLVRVEYRGRLAASPFLISRLLAAIGSEGRRTDVLAIAQKLRESSDVLWSNELLEQILRSGERPCVAGLPYYLVERWKRQGAPVEYMVPSPAPIAQFGATVSSQAPHPSAARLLAVWLASENGRAAREKVLYAVDLQKNSKSALARSLHATGLRFIVDDPGKREARNKLIAEIELVLAGRSVPKP